MRETPTVVMVHGAFSDGASWSPVAMRVMGAGIEVRVPAISNRSLAEDVAYVRSFVENIDGPVLLVGHSYGATVASGAGTAQNVRGLVFVAGFVLDVDESADDLSQRFPASDAADYFDYRRYATADGATRQEVSVAIDEFPFLAALGIPSDEAAVIAVTQRPLDAAVLSDRATHAAWHTRPTWGIVATADQIVNPDAVRFGLERASARMVLELPGPHLVLHTHPGDIARFIVDAANAVPLTA
ncbi:alpha/beta fold hydrolase [Microbacterium sp. NPDC006705]|uniref:alpha/beta fold hydrolase n=1 Tax=unclassified Microbacterium TaxID=2609290 RepID=UPI0022AFFDF7|nr:MULTISPECIES: alpha/beta hydrolase [unclassified Microbacterium]MCZ4067269.1 alpha/beta hydrolase [Microbacterium sp. H37-C3]WHE36506.1 alpha/beta hydrolase [Microbacterium sp. BDGP8]